MNQYRCETCKNYDKFFSSCKLTWYKESIVGKKETIHPIIKRESEWLINQVGCASHSNFQSEWDKMNKLVAWLYEEGMKFEKECDTEDDYKDAVSACARRAQCYYTIHKIEELRQEVNRG